MGCVAGVTGTWCVVLQELRQLVYVALRLSGVNLWHALHFAGVAYSLWHALCWKCGMSLWHMLQETASCTMSRSTHDWALFVVLQEMASCTMSKSTLRSVTSYSQRRSGPRDDVDAGEVCTTSWTVMTVRLAGLPQLFFLSFSQSLKFWKAFYRSGKWAVSEKFIAAFWFFLNKQNCCTNIDLETDRTKLKSSTSWSAVSRHFESCCSQDLSEEGIVGRLQTQFWNGCCF